MSSCAPCPSAGQKTNPCSKPTNVIGRIPPGMPVSDPANDPKLLAETQDRWWVEAYLPGLARRDLDPSFQAQSRYSFTVAVTDSNRFLTRSAQLIRQA